MPDISTLSHLSDFYELLLYHILPFGFSEKFVFSVLYGCQLDNKMLVHSTANYLVQQGLQLISISEYHYDLHTLDCLETAYIPIIK